MKYSLKTVTGYFNRNGYNNEEFTMIADQTDITISYKIGYVEVIKEGVILLPSEFTATNGTSIVLTNSASDGERIVVNKLNYRW